MQKWCKTLGMKDYINLMDIRSQTALIIAGKGLWPRTNLNLDMWDTRLIACRKDYKCLKCYLVCLQLILKLVGTLCIECLG